MARSIVCEKNLRKKMNWIMCVEWTNVKELRHKSCLFGTETNSLLSDDEGNNILA
jgi:hypothetical protein